MKLSWVKLDAFIEDVLGVEFAHMQIDVPLRSQLIQKVKLSFSEGFVLDENNEYETKVMLL